MIDEADRQTRGLKQFIETAAYKHQIYGMAWGDPASTGLVEVLERFVHPFVSVQSTVLEIGAGGGRWSRELNGRAGSLILVDGIAEFEIAIRHHMDCTRIVFLVSPDGSLPEVAAASVDFVFSFDTFVHFDAPLFDSYLATVGRILKPGGHFALHHARCFENCEFNPDCFKYRNEADVDSLLQVHGMNLVDAMDFQRGFGSRLVLVKKSGEVQTPKRRES